MSQTKNLSKNDFYTVANGDTLIININESEEVYITVQSQPYLLTRVNNKLYVGIRHPYLREYRQEDHLIEVKQDLLNQSCFWPFYFDIQNDPFQNPFEIKIIFIFKTCWSKPSMKTSFTNILINNLNSENSQPAPKKWANFSCAHKAWVLLNRFAKDGFMPPSDIPDEPKVEEYTDTTSVIDPCWDCFIKEPDWLKARQK
ncbi:MAG: hypothetical protein ACOC56_02165 [Atribacterota bacterium]